MSGPVSASAWDMGSAEDVGDAQTGSEEGFEDNFGDHVEPVRGLQLPADTSSKVGAAEEAGNGEPVEAAQGETEPSRSNFSTMWPFGHASRGHRRRSVGERYGRVENGRLGNGEHGTNDFFAQSGSDSDSDDGFDGVGEREASGDFEGERVRGGRGRRPSLTTEAKRRTSLDDEEVVEVGRGEGGDLGVVGEREGGEAERKA
jgi:hypothetical protein